MLPLSREQVRLETLRKGLVAYRSVIGQPPGGSAGVPVQLRFP
jgi:hypothetical protein